MNGFFHTLSVREFGWVAGVAFAISKLLAMPMIMSTNTVTNAYQMLGFQGGA